ncbi:MAG: mannose-1-phosphate guanylyltransferase/mannose-6-phosphate isomerase [Alphaproteobacteria bacterium]|nr:mannose-1-phosphate guanylyltransferase/mannose-6-phosphate isomerase [Alphaproteobacteria bacterium]
MAKIIPIILCGGSGTRLWPISRQDAPKQFLNLLGNGSLFQNTVKRAMRVSGAKANEVVTVSLGSMVKDAVMHLRAIDPALAQHVLGEPEARNTAAAFALAAFYVRKHFGEDALMFVLPSDHHIADEINYEQALKNATPAAEAGYLVTFGIKPTRPETGYGYIAIGDELSHKGVHTVKAFREKPKREVAQEYMDSGEYLWSSGMHLFRADTVIGKFFAHAPETAEKVEKAFFGGVSDRIPAQDLYCEIKKEPYEIAVLEKASDVVVVPSDIAWSDIGSWESLWEISGKDDNGNVTHTGPSGQVMTVKTENTFIRANDKMVACIGLRDLIVIETRDSILIADKTASDGIKEVVTQLQKAKAPEVLRSPSQQHSWGHSQVMSEGAGFRMKEMVVKPGGARSLKMHHHRSEQWVVVSGEGTFTINGQTKTIKAQDSVTIPARSLHQLVNTGKEPLRIYEFQYGAIIDDSDVVRFNDPDARAAEAPAAAPAKTAAKTEAA